MAYFGADGEIRPPRFRARRHAPGHRNSPVDCFYASHCPFRISLLKKEQAQKCLFFFGADGEIRTLAAVAHPTPLAGAPRHQLEYICKTVTITHTVKFNTD